MVAIVTGNGLGVERTSGWLLGSRGQLGDAAFGRLGENVTLNAATGNLVIQRTDEMLMGIGPDSVISRVYNSKGTFDADGNGDNWQLNVQRRVIGLTGTANTTGSTITLMDWDGSDVVYSYDAASGKYVSKEGAGAYDTLSYNSGSNVWTWTDGDSQATETYAAASVGWRLTQSRDLDGNTLTYAYTGDHLTSITTTDSLTGSRVEQVLFTWDTASGKQNNLLSVTTSYWNASGDTAASSITRVSYTYDSQNRLSTVTTDLTPGDTSDSSAVTTTYYYDGTSDRVTSIRQTGGARVDFTYTLTTGTTDDYRVTAITQYTASGVTRQTTISYDDVNHKTTITDPNNQATVLTYGATATTTNLLTQVDLPPAQAGTPAQVLKYAYYGDRHLKTVSDGVSNQVLAYYEYDANGNVTLQRDAAGNTVTRTYSATNALLSETRYTVPDPDGTGVGQPSGPFTTSYAYSTDGKQRLLFVVSPEGEVTEYGYDAKGQRTATIVYRDMVTTSGTASPAPALGSDPTSWAAALSTWRDGLDRSTVERADVTYDYRGNVATVTTYATASTTGAGTSTGKTVVTYTYDQFGKLLTRQTSGMTNTEVFAYDGLGRLIHAVDLNGDAVDTVFTDTTNKVVVTLASGVVQTSTYNLAGELTSFVEADNTPPVATTSYKYDSLGKLRIETSPTGIKTYHLYDAVGRKVADIAADGALVEYVYDKRNRIVATIAYSNHVDTSALVDESGNPIEGLALATVRPTTDDTKDVYAWRVYDNADRLIETIDGTGVAVIYAYDGMSNLVSTTSYVNKLTSSLATYRTTPPVTLRVPTANSGDVVTRNFYDGDGRLVGVLDGTGHLSEIRYNAAGEKIETIAYWTASTGDLAGGTLAALRPADNGNDQHVRYFYDNKGQLRYQVDASGQPTEFAYDTAGHLLHSYDYPGTIAAPASGGWTLAYVQGQIGTNWPATNTTPRKSFSVYDPATGQLAFSIDATGAVTSYGYDSLGRVISQTRYATLRTTTSDAPYATMVTWASTASTNTANRTTYMVYDQLGQLNYTIDAENGVTRYSYDLEGRKTYEYRYSTLYAGTVPPDLATMDSWSTSNADASTTRYVYDAFGRLSTVTAGYGSSAATTTAYGYDGLDRVSDVTEASGATDGSTSVTHTEYDGAGRVASVTRGYGAPEASTTSYAYDGFGRVNSVTVGAGTADAATTRTTYNAAGLVATVTRGYSTSEPEPSTTAYLYDAFGRVTDETVASGTSDASTTHYVYGADGRVASVARAYGTTDEAATSYLYDAFGNVLKATDALGGATYSFYDKLDRKTLEVDAEGYVTKTTYTLGGSVASIIRYATRLDLVANPITPGVAPTPVVTSGEDATTSFTYDRLERLTRSTDALGNYEQYTLDAYGNRVQVRNKLGGITDNVFDKLGRLLSETKTITTVNSDGSAGPTSQIRTSYSYDKRGNRTKMIEADRLDPPNNSANPEQRTTIYVYDKLDRLTSTVHDQVKVADGTTYVDGSSYVDVIETLVYDARGNVIESDDATGGRTLFFYDHLDRKIAEISPTGTLSTWSYDDAGNVKTARVYGTSVTLPASPGGTPPAGDANNYRITTYTYDKAGRMTSATSSGSTKIGTAAATTGVTIGSGAVDATSYTITQNTTLTTQTFYDKLGNITRQVDANGNSTYYYYDKLGRKIAQVDGERYYTLYTLDADGNVTREERSAYKLASVPATVDGLYANRIAYSQFGSGTTGWTTGYNPAGIVQNGGQPVSGSTGGVGYVKDQFVATASGQQVSMATDDNNWWSVSEGERLAVQAGVEAVGAVGSLRLTVWFQDPNGVWSSVDVATLSGAQAFNSKMSGFVTVPAGAVKARLELYMTTSGSGSGSFSLIQPMVTAVSASQVDQPAYVAGSNGSVALEASRITTFTYDKMGRRLTEKRLGVTAGTVNASTGALSVAASTATISYTYNALGEVTQKKEATGDYTDYHYDDAGRQDWSRTSAFTASDGVTSASVKQLTRYAYDRLGNLLSTTINAEGATSGDRVTSYTYGKGGRLATMTDASGFTRTYSYDAAGRLLKERWSRLTNAGSVIEANVYQYDAAGRVVMQSVATQQSDGTFLAGDQNQVQYNAYGDVSAQGVNGLQETFSYDNAGRAWKSTADDGTVKLYLYDGNGNQTFVIRSTGADLSAATQANVVTYANALRAGFVADKVGTEIVYDGRNQAVQTQSLFQQQTGAVTATTLASRSYNAFGEVASETAPITDANGNPAVTTYSYNTMGKLVRTELPYVSWTNEAGVDAIARPTRLNYYDISGRLVGVRDENGNLNTLSLLANTGHGGSDALVLKEFHADGGIFENRYDVFGDKRYTKNEIGRQEYYIYDGMGRLIEQDHEVRTSGTPGYSTTASNQLIDYYTYDGLGQRIKHTNSLFGTGTRETTDYDAQGRVTKMVDMGGNITSYSYQWDGSIATGGLGTFGGWVKTTALQTTIAGGTVVNIRDPETETLDRFGRTVAKHDFGSNDYAYTYDKGGRLVSMAIGGDTTTYGWYNSGLIAQTVSDDITTVYPGLTRDDRSTASYGYDAMGRRIAESYKAELFWSGSTTAASITQYENATVTWDAAGRMITLNDSRGSAAGDEASISWSYDLAGNIRHMHASYYNINNDGSYGSLANPPQDFWYKYDAMNRFVTTKGTLSGGQIVRGYTGTDIGYDKAGQRISATSTISYLTNRREDYGYTADGYLATVRVATWAVGGTEPTTSTADTKLQANYVIDTLGRVTALTEYGPDGVTAWYTRTLQLNTKGQIIGDTTATREDDGHWRWSDTDYYFDSNGDGTGLYQGGATTRIVSNTWRTDSADRHDDVSDYKTGVTTNSYVWRDSAIQSSSAYDSDVTDSDPSVVTTSYIYDGFGRLKQTSANQPGDTVTTNFVTDANGVILERREIHSSDTGRQPRQVYYYFDGTAVGDISNNGTSDVDYVTSISHRFDQGYKHGIFRYGTSSGQPYADFDQSYDPINGFSYDETASRYTVRTGDTLQSIAQTVWGDSSLWYKIADANGLDGTETLAAGRTLLIPNKVANIHNNASTYRVYDPNEAISGDIPTTYVKPPKNSSKCGVFGQILLMAIAVAVIVISHQYELFSALGPIGGGAATGALASVVSQGVGVATGIQDKFSFKGVAIAAIAGGVSGGLDKLGGFLSGSGVANVAARGVVSSLATQGIAVATGLQHSFDWAGVAAAGVGAAAGGVIGGGILGNVADGLASAATRSLITGTDFGDNIMAVLPSVIGNTIGSFAQKALKNVGQKSTSQSGQRPPDDGLYSTRYLDGPDGVGGPAQLTNAQLLYGGGYNGEKASGVLRMPLDEARARYPNGAWLDDGSGNGYYTDWSQSAPVAVASAPIAVASTPAFTAPVDTAAVGAALESTELVVQAQVLANAPGAQLFSEVAPALQRFLGGEARTPAAVAGLVLGFGGAYLAGTLNTSTDGVPNGPDIEFFPSDGPRTPLSTGHPIPVPQLPDVESLPGEIIVPTPFAGYPAVTQGPTILSTPMPSSPLGPITLTAEAAETEVPLTAGQLRGAPGVATASGDLAPASGRWLDPGVPTPIPGQVADALVGRNFNSFNDLRSAIWEQIGGNAELNGGFSRGNLGQMNAGNAPFAPSEYLADSGAFGERFNLHHIDPIANGGPVYDLSNLRIVSPKVHYSIHYGPGF
ncbi:LysM peptidoglycan-binding domain-containing protein [Flavisphingomonas formosensis]|uniref:LysM peptidoglycan-binding domain-containing protein n=1 Tax=Flavisphingomonas formosensis TaxID=861534 RepID=UPI0012F87633|nr:LysM peptidoglycan-binding domain-containing protein [Sphingomonas formosensis]